MMNRRVFLLIGSTGVLAGCSGTALSPDLTTFRSAAGVPAEVVRSWTVAAIEIEVPASLTVSEDPDTRFPGTDIVWWEDPAGDRRAQVQRVMSEAVAAAVSDLTGPEPVTLRLRVNKFHALTPDALENGTRGWHDVNFDIAILSQAGQVLAEERSIDADIRALQGSASEAALARGETQASRIKGRVEGVLRAWLGTL